MAVEKSSLLKASPKVQYPCRCMRDRGTHYSCHAGFFSSTAQRTPLSQLAVLENQALPFLLHLNPRRHKVCGRAHIYLGWGLTWTNLWIPIPITSTSLALYTSLGVWMQSVSLGTEYTLVGFVRVSVKIFTGRGWVLPAFTAASHHSH